MLAYWNGQFFYQYLADPSDEHVPPSQTFLMTSKDGYRWTNPEIVFPPYKVPDGYTKESRPGVQAKDLIEMCIRDRDRIYLVSIILILIIL